MGKDQVKEAIELAGSQHKYQYILIGLISLSWIILNFVLLGSTLIFINPAFYCNQDFTNKVFEKQACPQITQCQIVQKFTLTAELELYCDLEWARDIIQSIFGLGSLGGLFVMNLVSDTKSRKAATIASLVITTFGLLFTLIGGFAKSIPLIIIANFIQGFGTSSILSLSYAFLSDYCSDRIKPRSVIIVNTAWSLSTILLGVFYLIEIRWSYYLLFVILIPLVLVTVLFQIYLIQSPYIFMLRNKPEQALKVLEKVAEINFRLENYERIKKIIENQEQKDETTQASLKNVAKTIRKWQYLKTLIVLSVIRTIGAFNFFGTSYAFGVQGLGLGYNSMIAGFAEIISYMGLTFFVNQIPRRKGIAGFYFIVMLIGLLFLIPNVRGNLVLGTILMSTSRIFSTTSYTLIASVQTQAFTVEIQSTAVGIIEAFGLMGAMCAPLMVDLGDKIGIDPVALIAILVNFAVWPNIFLKQTLNAHLKPKKQPLLDNQDLDRDVQGYKQSLLSQQTVPTSSEGIQSPKHSDN